jgi:membrane protease YdiL (CAAX protease family)
MIPDVVMALPLGIIAFVFNKRPVKFFGIRSVGLRDVRAAILAFFASFAVVAIAEPVVNAFVGPSPSAPGGDPLRTAPLWQALVLAVLAGICEEFVYRGFLIEELGLLIRNRGFAAVAAMLSFALAHHNTLGWSIELIYPGLIGAVITALYLWRRNLPICMLLHAALDSLHAVMR